MTAHLTRTLRALPVSLLCLLSQLILVLSDPTVLTQATAEYALYHQLLNSRLLPLQDSQSGGRLLVQMSQMVLPNSRSELFKSFGRIKLRRSALEADKYNSPDSQQLRPGDMVQTHVSRILRCLSPLPSTDPTMADGNDHDVLQRCIQQKARDRIMQDAKGNSSSNNTNSSPAPDLNTSMLGLDCVSCAESVPWEGRILAEQWCRQMQLDPVRLALSALIHEENYLPDESLGGQLSSSAPSASPAFQLSEARSFTSRVPRFHSPTLESMKETLLEENVRIAHGRGQSKGVGKSSKIGERGMDGLTLRISSKNFTELGLDFNFVYSNLSTGSGNSSSSGPSLGFTVASLSRRIFDAGAVVAIKLRTFLYIRIEWPSWIPTALFARVARAYAAANGGGFDGPSSRKSFSYGPPESFTWSSSYECHPENYFIPEGSRGMLPQGLILLNGAQVLLKTAAKFTPEEQQFLKTDSSLAVWPFIGGAAPAAYASVTQRRVVVEFDREGRMAIETAPTDSPFIFAYIMKPLASSSPTPITLQGNTRGGRSNQDGGDDDGRDPELKQQERVRQRIGLAATNEELQTELQKLRVQRKKQNLKTV